MRISDIEVSVRVCGGALLYESGVSLAKHAKVGIFALASASVMVTLVARVSADSRSNQSFTACITLTL